jgi:hypothetical protein
MEICLYICARCSVFYYYYPMARGVGLMVERIAGCTTKIAAFTRDTEVKSKVSQRQIIRIDWSRSPIPPPSACHSTARCAPVCVRAYQISGKTDASTAVRVHVRILRVQASFQDLRVWAQQPKSLLRRVRHSESSAR